MRHFILCSTIIGVLLLGNLGVAGIVSYEFTASDYEGDTELGNALGTITGSFSYDTGATGTNAFACGPDGPIDGDTTGANAAATSS